MQFQWQELIDRARVYVGDDHNDTGGYIAPTKWLTFGNVELAQLRKRWIRMGLISEKPTDTSFAGNTTTINGVLCLIGVAQDLGAGRMRVLEPAQSRYGRAPFWTRIDANPAQWWQATGPADNLLIELEPRDTTGTYVVRWLPTLAYATDATTTVDLPYGGDERLVLGIAKRANVKDSHNSLLLADLIKDADAELNFTAFGRANNDGPRVRTARSTPRFTGFSTDPSLWRYL